jgi:hypothetical protein
VLARVVKAIEGEEAWLRSPNQAFLRVLRQAIDQLPDPMTGRQPRGEKPYTGPWQGAPARRIALILFGEGDADPEVKRRFDHEGRPRPLTYNTDYLPAARRLAKVDMVSDRERQRPFPVIREDLVDILLKMEQEAITAREQAQAKAEVSEPVSSDPGAPFVPRERLFRDFMSAWLIKNAPEGPWPLVERICLVGDAGTGKTRFLQNTLAATRAFWINGEADETMVPAMYDLLAAYGEDAPQHTEASLIKRDFGLLLGRPGGPPLVIIDGIPDPTTLDSFVPSHTNTRLVVTSRKRPPEGWSPVVEVSDMTLDEATAMAAALLTDASEQDCQALASMLGRCPLLIEHACTFLAPAGANDIQDFCAAVRQDITSALSAIADRTEWVLTAIYRRHVAQLSEEAPESLRLLELLPWLPHLYIPHEYLMSDLLGVPYISPDLYARADLAYRAAIRPLETHSLVTVKPYGVFIRPLVQSILRRIFADHLPALVTRIPPQVDRLALYEAGWHAFTVSGRETCNHIFSIYAEDTSLRQRALTGAGVVGGATWELMVERFHTRAFKWEAVHCAAEGRSPTAVNRDSFDWEEFTASLAQLKPLQSYEHLAFTSYMMSSARNIPEDEPEQGTPEWEKSFVDAMLSLRLRTEDSPLGRLDLGLFDSDLITEEDVDATRQRLHDLFFPKGEQSAEEPPE